MDSNESTPSGNGAAGSRGGADTGGAEGARTESPGTAQGAGANGAEGATPQGAAPKGAHGTEATREFPAGAGQAGRPEGIGNRAASTHVGQPPQGGYGNPGNPGAPGQPAHPGHPGAPGQPTQQFQFGRQQGPGYPGGFGYPVGGAHGAPGAQGAQPGTQPGGGAIPPYAPQPGAEFGGPQDPMQQPYGYNGQELAAKKKSPKALTALGIVAAMVIAGGVGGVVGANMSHSGGSSIIGSSSGAQAVPASEPTDGTVESVAEKVLPSVVSIAAVGPSGGGEGSGIIISGDGKILTNNHVVAAGGNGGQLQVSFNDGSMAEATVVGTDPTSDIAVIQVKDKTGLQPINIGTSSNLKVGQDVVAIGSPLGLSGTVTTGIVSSLNRPVMAGGAESGQSTVIDAVQTDAAINPGNSGGALVDMGGNLVGMNSAIASLGSGQESGSIGLGFAIPVEQAQRIAQQLIDQGFATRAVLGASVRSDSTVAGAQIDGVQQGSAADKAGIPDKAVVTKLDDRTIDSGDALVAAVRSKSPGDKVQITYHEGENGPEKTVEVTLGEAK
ncbi:S1C family serine protease [Dietzia sp.]|uniref:S1C family serine protease n=1 Tax=Dietzia sp. TaxID=1871616 RepID=UPI002FDAE3EF